MRRRNPFAQSSGPPVVYDQDAQEQGTPKERLSKRYSHRSALGLAKAAVGHPLFGFVLFLIIFPGWALVSTIQRRCLDGDLPGCKHNDPPPVLVRSSQASLYLPSWRLDGRCGFDFPSPADPHSSICNPFSKTPCCSQWGWCGSGPDYCTQAVKAPYNVSGTGQ